MPVSLKQTQSGSNLDAASLLPNGRAPNLTHCEVFLTRRTVDGTETHATLAQLNPRRIYRITGDPVANFPAAYIAQHQRGNPVANIITVSFREARLPIAFSGGAVGIYAHGVFDGAGALTNNGTLYALLSDPDADVFVKVVNGAASFTGVLSISPGVVMDLPVLANYPVASESAFGLARAASDQQVADGDEVNRYVQPHQVADITVDFASLSAAQKNAIKAIVGEMVSGNTETLINVPYQSADRTLDFVLDSNIKRIFVGTTDDPPAAATTGDLYFKREA